MGRNGSAARRPSPPLGRSPPNMRDGLLPDVLGSLGKRAAVVTFLESIDANTVPIAD